MITLSLLSPKLNHLNFSPILGLTFFILKKIKIARAISRAGFAATSVSAIATEVNGHDTPL